MQSKFAALLMFEMFDRVGDIDRSTIKTGIRQGGGISNPASRANEGLAGAVFFVAGLFADRHQRRPDGPFAKHDLRRIAIERAAGAMCGLRRRFLQLLGGRASSARVMPRAPAAPARARASSSRQSASCRGAQLVCIVEEDEEHRGASTALRTGAAKSPSRMGFPTGPGAGMRAAHLIERRRVIAAAVKFRRTMQAAIRQSPMSDP